MLTVQAVPISQQLFSPFGIYQQVKVGTGLSGDRWNAWMTDEVCLDKPAYFSVNFSVSQPAMITGMQRNVHTDEMLLSSDQPILFVVADSIKTPTVADCHAFLLRPGDLVIINKNIWRSPCYGMVGETCYYSLTTKYADAEHMPVEALKIDFAHM